MQCKTKLLLGVLIVFLFLCVPTVAAESWNPAEIWSFTINYQLEWRLAETWNFTLNATAEWTGAETWSFDLINITSAEWTGAETWSFDLATTTPPSWHFAESWSMDAGSSADWSVAETWSLQIGTGFWQLAETWNFTINTTAYDYTYTLYGAYSEDTGARDGNATVTVYPYYGTAYNVTVDGEYKVYSEYEVVYFRFWLENNMSRYYAPMSLYENIYAFNPADPYYVYTVDFVDLLGVTDAYLESYITTNGTVYPVERRRVQAGMQIPFVLTFGREYGFRLHCDQGTYDFGRYIPATDDTITLTITPLSFPATVLSYGNITLSATRVNSTYIQVLYLDSGNQTVSVNVTIIMRRGSQSQTEYSTEQVATSTLTESWYDAEENRDYLALVTANHTDYGVLSWEIPCSRVSIGDNPWDFSFLGSFPFDSSQLVGFALVMCVFACFSSKDAHIGMLVSIVVAAIFVWMQWLAIGWTTITILFCLVVMFALTRRRIE